MFTFKFCLHKCKFRNVFGIKKYFFDISEICFYLRPMEGKKKIKKRYSYPLKLDEKLKSRLSATAKKNRRTINEEINVAVEYHLNVCALNAL
jgi:hypothetical protein